MWTLLSTPAAAQGDNPQIVQVNHRSRVLQTVTMSLVQTIDTAEHSDCSIVLRACRNAIIKAMPSDFSWFVGNLDTAGRGRCFARARLQVSLGQTHVEVTATLVEQPQSLFLTQCAQGCMCQKTCQCFQGEQPLKYCSHCYHLSVWDCCLCKYILQSRPPERLTATQEAKTKSSIILLYNSSLLTSMLRPTVRGPVVDSGSVAVVVTMTSLSLVMGHAPGKLAPDCPLIDDPSVVWPCATAASAAAVTKHRSKPTPDMGASLSPSLQEMTWRSCQFFCTLQVWCQLLA